MKNRSLIPLLVMLIAIGLASCTKDGIDVKLYTDSDYQLLKDHLDLPNEPTDYTIHFPEYSRNSRLAFNNQLVTLGKVLFYDENLSEDKTISCASCHKQHLAFADDVAFSKGILNRDTDRNSLALGSVFNFNVYYGPDRIPFFWDNRASTVQEQTEQTFANEKEMGMNMDEVVQRVQEEEFYNPLFKAAYGVDVTVTEDKVLDAISEFVNSMGSYNNVYDQALEKHHQAGGSTSQAYSLANTDLPLLSAQENIGKTLYVNKCGSCHGVTNGAPSRNDANNGLDNVYADNGIGLLTNYTGDEGMFKIPTLRNIALSGPYMHDGRFETLEEVVEHYSTGVQDHPNLSQELRTNSWGSGEPIQFNFSSEEKEALLAFLHTFTDESFVNDVRYADPFK